MKGRYRFPGQTTGHRRQAQDDNIYPRITIAIPPAAKQPIPCQQLGSTERRGRTPAASREGFGSLGRRYFDGNLMQTGSP